MIVYTSILFGIATIILVFYIIESFKEIKRDASDIFKLRADKLSQESINSPDNKHEIIDSGENNG